MIQLCLVPSRSIPALPIAPFPLPLTTPSSIPSHTHTYGQLRIGQNFQGNKHLLNSKVFSNITLKITSKSDHGRPDSLPNHQFLSLSLDSVRFVLFINHLFNIWQGKARLFQWTWTQPSQFIWLLFFSSARTLRWFCLVMCGWHPVSTPDISNHPASFIAIREWKSHGNGYMMVGLRSTLGKTWILQLLYRGNSRWTSQRTSSLLTLALN